ncbi:response regulator [Vibrio sp. TBV020]|uniref:hybrid sensor histidine kinase/response regulator n=1 Tax=Vibrio sp. TBV020 TaxID=3137398 RepID=UPI0038CD4566
MQKIVLNTVNTPERLKLVLDSTRLGMWDWSPVTNEVVFDNNWAKMLGLKLSDLSMTLDDWSSRVHPDDMDSCLADIQAHLEGKTEFYENMHRMKHANGNWVYILDRGQVVERDSEGNALRFTGTHADMTALKSAEFDALLATKAKERFFSSMSHELRAPLHAMLGLLELVQKDHSASDVPEKLKIIHDSGHHLLNVVNNLLDASRLQHTSLNIKQSEFDIVELLYNAHDLFSYRVQEKGLTLTLVNNLDSGDCFLLSDRSRFFQVLINLISNAIKFTDHGSITLALSKVPQAIKLDVIDTGKGIDDLSKIFLPFFSKDASEKYDDAASTGLGLNISKEIVDSLGCEMSVQSQIGQGSTFSVVIPSTLVVEVKGRTATSLQEFTTSESTMQGWEGKVILAVDDTPINLVLLQAMLSVTPVELVKAKSAQQALDILKEKRVDLIITDLHMPAQGGLELTKRVRSNPRLSRVPIIISSADTKQEAWPRCVEVEASEFLEKPFSSNQLLSALHAYL